MLKEKGLRIIILPKSNKTHVPESLYELELHPEGDDAILKIELSKNGHDSYTGTSSETAKHKIFSIPTRKLLETLNGDAHYQKMRTAFSNREMKLFEEAVKIIDEEIASLPTIEVLSRRVGFNQNKLQHAFQLAHNISVNEYVKRKRLELAVHYLENSSHNMSEITELIGLTSRSYFAKTFQEYYNIKPSAYRKLKKQDALLTQSIK
ncbi:AraC family transcriptional regulator [Dokdonia sinensis]|uniref:AraC family transcriptional regulator n=1 Tax=Dokdonia sinensis TaxID=2479847 RepID=A0A3M0GE28_9FLAO|nr:AraC family transcriptional regulator [Dokdonia sinensis]RMB62727.1 AraC family transcriptional regulator [Dokdonia sinensis]